jgi:hypothetical protein
LGRKILGLPAARMARLGHGKAGHQKGAFFAFPERGAFFLTQIWRVSNKVFLTPNTLIIIVLCMDWLKTAWPKNRFCHIKGAFLAPL